MNESHKLRVNVKNKWDFLTNNLDRTINIELRWNSGEYWLYLIPFNHPNKEEFSPTSIFNLFQIVQKKITKCI